ncbi:hypothetical protein CLOSCI_00376 [[Clostridium] scindens ATCC 35704]|nr:hypothetical protein CLOSCI_00376 [[Clostridium] scindens ATCC 35704]
MHRSILLGIRIHFLQDIFNFINSSLNAEIWQALIIRGFLWLAC